MKRILIIALFLVLSAGLFACGDKAPAADEMPTQAPTESTTLETTTQPPTNASTDTSTAQEESNAPQPKQKPKRMTSYHMDGTPHFTMTYEYDEKGNEIRREQQLDGSTIIYTLKNTYNEKDQLVQAEIRINNGTADYITYEYNADGQLIRTHITDNDFGEFGGYTTYTYNEQGQLIQNLSGDECSSYEYDAQGLLSRENIYYGDTEDTLSRYYIYEY